MLEVDALLESCQLIWSAYFRVSPIDYWLNNNMHSIRLFHATYSNAFEDLKIGDEFKIFPLMHFGSLEAALHRIAFIYADEHQHKFEMPSVFEGLKINGKIPKIYEVEFWLDEGKIREFLDWGDPGAMGTANKLREGLAGDKLWVGLSEKIGQLHQKLWNDLVSDQNYSRRDHEFENRAFVANGVSELGLEVATYKNFFEGKDGSLSYCFMCQPVSSILRVVHDIQLNDFCEAIEKMRPKVSKSLVR